MRATVYINGNYTDKMVREDLVEKDNARYGIVSRFPDFFPGDPFLED